MADTKNTPILYTERLLLRRFTEGDLEAFFAIGSDRQANTFLPFFPFESAADAAARLDKYLESYSEPEGCRYAICLKEDDVPIGYVTAAGGDSYDFGYALRTPFWHRGIVTEACTAVLQHLKDTGVPYITATHDVNNPRSGAVMQKLGMVYCYSYEELWQPKNFAVIFRMYQLNLNGQHPVYSGYREKYPVHFIEEV